MGQWLGSGDLFADFGSEESIVRLDGDAMDHPLIRGLSDNEHGQSVQSSREAMHLAGEAASRARARGSIDGEGRIVVTGEAVASIAVRWRREVTADVECGTIAMRCMLVQQGPRRG